MSMKITALTENTCPGGEFGTEHGLSLYIETESRRILFDMGQTALFAENAEKLGIDLSAVDLAVVSHGHYDHGGGLLRFLELNQRAPVYIRRSAFETHYHGSERYIGLNPTLLNSRRLVFTGEVFPIEEGLSLYACCDREPAYLMEESGLSVERDGKLLPEDFCHEQYLLIEEQGKKILISGCSHKGILNLAHWFRPDVLVGGFHLSKLAPGEKLRGYAERLDSYDTDFYTCHCTGEEQFVFMKKYMKNLSYLSAGSCIWI